MGVKIRFQYNSEWTDNRCIPDYKPVGDYRVSRQRMGGYTFPILDQLQRPYEVTIYSPAESVRDYRTLVEHVRQPDSILAYVDTRKLVSVRCAGGAIGDLGLQAVTNGLTSKSVKRMKTLCRPFRIHTTLPELRVQIVPGGAELDGGGIVSKRIYDLAVANIQPGYWNPVQRAGMIHWAERQVFHNARFPGRTVNAETDELLGLMIKGNFIVSEDVPEGVDIITCEENLKKELIGDSMAWALFEPQGSKAAWEDQQTLSSHPFLISISEARERVADEATKQFEMIQSGTFMNEVLEMTRSDYSRDFAWDEDRLNSSMEWAIENWLLHGLPFNLSSWLTTRVGSAWVASMRVNSPDKVRIKIPCAIRAQFVSESIVRLAGYKLPVPRGTARWCCELSVLVANDDDWRDIVIDSHGGCDLDDFFVIRWRTVNGEPKIIVTRSPNTRGEYTVWDFVEDDWYPAHVNAAGVEESFPEISCTVWPKQILQALEDKDTHYIDIPSVLDPPQPGPWRRYTRSDVLGDLWASIGIEGGYGQYELAVRAFHSLSSTRLAARQIRSEDAVDAFTQGGTPEDRRFILDDRDRIIREIRASGQPVDAVIGRRLGVDDIAMTSEAFISQIKKVIATETAAYTHKLNTYAKSLPVPGFLAELGKNRMLGYATQILRRSRLEMYLRDQYCLDLDSMDRTREIRSAQESYVWPHFERFNLRLDRAQLAMAFWYACRTTPTSQGNFTDQPVFGLEKIFRATLDGLLYYGIAGKPEVNLQGHVFRHYPVVYNGAGSWTVTCKSCGKNDEIGHNALVRYWDAKQVCRQCREVN